MITMPTARVRSPWTSSRRPFLPSLETPLLLAGLARSGEPWGWGRTAADGTEVTVLFRFSNNVIVNLHWVRLPGTCWDHVQWTWSQQMRCRYRLRYRLRPEAGNGLINRSVE